jgi:class 3 adenylate cyclase
VELPSRFEVAESVSRGGQAEVLKALDVQHDRFVALKVYAPSDESAVGDLTSEARLLLSLPPHPALPIVRDSFFVEDRTRYVIVIDWIDGIDLATLLREHGDPGLPLSRVVDYVAQAAAALDHLHAQHPPVIHCDVKPANLILANDHRIVLVDFGISTFAAHAQRAGSRGYVAPEVAAGNPLTPAADIYGLAATTLALLTGRPPDGRQPVLDVLEPAAAGWIGRALRRGLAFDPARRPQSAGEFAERLCAGRNALPSGVVTFLAAEVVGADDLWDSDADAMEIICRRLDDIVAEVVDVHRGRVVRAIREGEGMLSAFAEASAAAATALALHDRTHAEEWPRRMEVRLRAALHSGEVHPHEGAYLSETVNRAARLRVLAPPGGTNVSAATAELLERHLPAGSRLTRLETRGDGAHVCALEKLPDGGSAPRPLADDQPLPILAASSPRRHLVLASFTIGALVLAAIGVFVGFPTHNWKGSSRVTATSSEPTVANTASDPFASVIIPTPPGFHISTSRDVHNGMLDRLAFDNVLGAGAAAETHFVRGYDITYDSDGAEYFDVLLADVGSASDVVVLTNGVRDGFPTSARVVRFDSIANATEIDDTTAEKGVYQHAVIAGKGAQAMMVTYFTDRPGIPRLLASIVHEQYARLHS